MNENQTGVYGYLDNIRIHEGPEKCRAVFSELCQKNPRQAAAYLNDRRLTFPCLFLLRRQAEAHALSRYMNLRCLTALRIMRQILEPQKTGRGDNILSKANKTVYMTLKWMLETGRSEEMLDDMHEYEELLDTAVSLLIITYKDKSVLPVAADMLFERNRMGRHVHTLAWALFQTGDPKVLSLIAGHINAAEPEDAELACSLLNIDRPGDEGLSREELYGTYAGWLEENSPFLSFTGESLQYSSKPEVYKVDLESKYLNRSPDDKRRRQMAGDRRHIEAFAALDDKDKRLLSEHSYKLRKQNISKWREWMDSPIEEQLEGARAEGGWLG